MAEDNEVPVTIVNEDGSKTVIGTADVVVTNTGIDIVGSLANDLAKKLGLAQDYGSFSIVTDDEETERLHHHGLPTFPRIRVPKTEDELDLDEETRRRQEDLYKRTFGSGN